MIRLQGGAYSSKGRVEVYCNEQWGTLCNADFDSSDATSLCRQLGYDDYHRFNHLAMLVLLYNEVDKFELYRYGSFSQPICVMIHYLLLIGIVIITINQDLISSVKQAHNFRIFPTRR